MSKSITQLRVSFIEACPDLHILWKSVCFPSFPVIECCYLASEEPLITEPGTCYVGTVASLRPLLASLPGSFCITFFVVDAGEDFRQYTSSLSCNLFCVSGEERMIYNTVNRLFSTYRRWLYQFDEMIFHHVPVKDMVESAARMLQAPVFLLSSSYSLIAASTQNVPLSPLLMDILDQGFLSPAAAEQLHLSEQLDILAIQQGISVLSFLVLPAEVSLAQKHNLLPIALYGFRQLLASHEQGPVGNTRAEFRQLLTDLLDSNLTSPEELQSRLSILKPEWKNYFTCLLVEPQDGYSNTTPIAYIIPLLEQLFPSSYFFVYRSAILGILPSPSRELPEFSLPELGDLLQAHHCAAGFVGPVSRLKNLRLFYNMTVATIQFGNTLGHTDFSFWPLLTGTDYPVFYFEDIRLYYIADLCQKGFLHMFHSDDLITLCHPDILHLYLYDQENHTEYLNILEVWLTSGCNMTQAGRRLHFHRNSMIYKIHRIEEILHISLSDTIMQQHLLFSCIMFRYIREYLHIQI